MLAMIDWIVIIFLSKKMLQRILKVFLYNNTQLTHINITFTDQAENCFLYGEEPDPKLELECNSQWISGPKTCSGNFHQFHYTFLKLEWHILASVANTSRMLITSGTGASYEQFVEVTEIIDFEEGDNIEIHSGYPTSVSAATGGIFKNGALLICGGEVGINSYNANYFSECYTLGSDQVVARLIKPRSNAASIMWTNHDGKEVLWITGGQENKDYPDEVTGYNCHSEAQSLSHWIQEHCLVHHFQFHWTLIVWQS